MYDKDFNKDENGSHRSYGHGAYSNRNSGGHGSYGHSNGRDGDGHESGSHGGYGHRNSESHSGYGHRDSGSRGGYGHGYSGSRGGYSHSNSHDHGNDRSRRTETAYNEKVSPIKLGIVQELYVQRFVEFGAYLGADEERVSKEDKEDAPKGAILEVLLPKNELSSDISVGDIVDVFVYLDSSDRPVATLATPKITLGKIAPLTVKELSKFGAFLDWGLPKDLFMPFGEMKEHPKEGETVLVRLYIDKSGRLAASEKDIYKMLSTDSPYKKDDEVTGRVYELGVDFGIFVAVDDKYSAMIPKSEKHDELHIGNVITARVMDVKEDGKLDISLRDKAYAEIDTDAEALYQLLDEYGGVFPFTEKATPAVIERETGLSKAAFKRAIGRLYKERKITLNNGVIRKNVEE